MADAMSMQKDIIDRIREQGGDFLIGLEANQRSLRYGVEDRPGRRSQSILSTPAAPLLRFTWR